MAISGNKNKSLIELRLLVLFTIIIEFMNWSIFFYYYYLVGEKGLITDINQCWA